MLIKYGISKLTLENMIYVIERQGFDILEYSQYQCDDSVWSIIKRLNLIGYAQAGKAFAYQHGNTRIVFLCEELTADEKLYALAHEEGHILCGHLNSDISDSSLVEQERLANEIAHYLLYPPLFVRLQTKILERKKLVISILILIICGTLIITPISLINRNRSYYEEYYKTENGTKYHKKDCLIIKNKNNIHRLTKSDYESDDYEACQVCLPD